MLSRPNFGAAAVLYKKEYVLLHCIAFPTFCQRVIIIYSNSSACYRLNYVCTDIEVTTVVEYMVQPTVNVSHRFTDVSLNIDFDKLIRHTKIRHKNKIYKKI